MGFFIRKYFLNYWDYIKNVTSIFIGNLTQFNFLVGFFLLICLVYELFRKNWKKPPSNPPLPPAHLLPAGTFSMLFRTFPSTVLPIFKTTRFFFSIFAILTGLIRTNIRFFQHGQHLAGLLIGKKITKLLRLNQNLINSPCFFQIIFVFFL